VAAEGRVYTETQKRWDATVKDKDENSSTAGGNMAAGMI